MKANVHVYAVLRVKVIGVEGQDPAIMAEDISEAVCARPDQWFDAVHGSIKAKLSGACDIEHVEFAEEVAWTMVDELDEQGNVKLEHHFDTRMEPMAGLSGAHTAREAQLERQIETSGRIEEDPDFPVSDWMYEVANGDTMLGYGAWVSHQDRDHLLQPWRAVVREVSDGSEASVFAFDCSAENKEHAIEQAHNAYPAAAILTAYPSDGSAFAIQLLDDQPTTCPKCGTRTDFEDLEHAFELHTCLNGNCSYRFIAEQDGDGVWYIDEANCDDTTYFVDSLMQGGFTVVAKAEEKGLSIHIFPPAVADKPAASLEVAWEDLRVPPPSRFKDDEPEPQFHWTTSADSQYGYLNIRGGAVVSIKQEAEGLIIDAWSAGHSHPGDTESGEECVATACIPYEDIAAVVNQPIAA